METFSAKLFGQRLREVRGGMTQAEFAKVMEITTPTVIRYESGERLPSVDFLHRLITTFGVAATWILQGGEDRQLSLPVTSEEAILLGSYRNSGKRKDVIREVADMASQLEKGGMKIDVKSG
jgi:transcriptional regulator with XRE-family HTH domain